MNPRINPPLVITGWIHCALLAVLIVLSQFDSRTILGINPWIKPMKFSASIVIYLWTLAWYLRYLAEFKRPVRTISWGIAISMLAEIFCITLQAARGTTSHYNVTTPLDAGLFTTMGIMIALNSLLAAWALVLFFTTQPPIPRAYLWGIRLGLILFLLAGAQGGVMIAHHGHTVGAPDGGPGWSFVNWSREHGDLRIAHFAGLHALQVLPLIGYLLGRSRWPESTQVRCIIAAAIGYLGVIALLAWLAWQARPLTANERFLFTSGDKSCRIVFNPSGLVRQGGRCNG